MCMLFCIRIPLLSPTSPFQRLNLQKNWKEHFLIKFDNNQKIQWTAGQSVELQENWLTRMDVNMERHGCMTPRRWEAAFFSNNGFYAKIGKKIFKFFQLLVCLPKDHFLPFESCSFIQSFIPLVGNNISK